jgi:hypothetical protein
LLKGGEDLVERGKKLREEGCRIVLRGPDSRGTPQESRIVRFVSEPRETWEEIAGRSSRVNVMGVGVGVGGR